MKTTIPMQYYMIIGGAQTGPFNKEQLLYNGLTPQTPVWREGMQNWIPAEQLPELSDLFEASDDSAFGGYAAMPQDAPQYRQYAPGQGNNKGYGQQRIRITNRTNWMPWAIVGTVLGLCSCLGLVFGIIGIVNASKANNLYAAGDDYLGDAANSTAKTMTIISLVIGGLNLIGSFIYLLIYGAAIFASVANM